jgi:small-conductance mechanosensitive channel
LKTKELPKVTKDSSHFDRIFGVLLLVGTPMGRYQEGYIYDAFGAFHVRYYATAIVDGKPKRVHKSRLRAKDDKYHSRSCKSLRQKCDDFMRTINAGHWFCVFAAALPEFTAALSALIAGLNTLGASAKSDAT